VGVPCLPAGRDSPWPDQNCINSMKIGNNKLIFEVMTSNYIREDKHWGADLDIIKPTIDELLSRTKRRIHYLDIGCGTGFHIANIGEIYPEISITGIDYSPGMLREARKKIHFLRLKNVNLRQADVTSLDIKQKYDIITFLNNGFGNVFKEGAPSSKLRRIILEKIHSLLDNNGYLIISVYNKEKLTQNYGKHLRILGNKSDFKNGDLFVEYKIANRIVAYYSHWFSKAELRDILQHSGFKIDFLEKRLCRFLLRAIKK